MRNLIILVLLSMSSMIVAQEGMIRIEDLDRTFTQEQDSRISSDDYSERLDLNGFELNLPRKGWTSAFEYLHHLEDGADSRTAPRVKITFGENSNFMQFFKTNKGKEGDLTVVVKNDGSKDSYTLVLGNALVRSIKQTRMGEEVVLYPETLRWKYEGGRDLTRNGAFGK